MVSKKELDFINAVFEVITTFGECEVGSTEIDLEAVSRYLNSERVLVDFFDLSTKDSMLKYLTDEILRGEPVWYFLKISDWTKKMLDRSFLDMIDKENEEMKRKFICLRGCVYYDRCDTNFGVIETCKSKDTKNQRPFKYKRKCRFFSETEPEPEPVKEVKYNEEDNEPIKINLAPDDIVIMTETASRWAQNFQNREDGRTWNVQTSEENDGY